MRLEKHPLFDCDLEEAALWYHERDPAAAQRLIRRVESLLREIALNPFRFSIYHRDVRRAAPKPFPFRIFYTVEADKVWIAAMIHSSRDSGPILRNRQNI